MNFEEHTRAIIVADNGLMNFFLRINHIPSEQEWRIQNVEVYTTFESANLGKAGPELVSDDVEFDKLPHATKMAVWAALDSWQHRRREAMNRLNIDIGLIKRTSVTS